MIESNNTCSLIYTGQQVSIVSNQTRFSALPGNYLTLRAEDGQHKSNSKCTSKVQTMISTRRESTPSPNRSKDSASLGLGERGSGWMTVGLDPGSCVRDMGFSMLAGEISCP